MLSYCTLNIQQDSMNTNSNMFSTLHQYGKNCSELQGTLLQLFQKISSVQDEFKMNPFSTTAAILVQHASVCLKKCREREDMRHGHISSVDEFSCQLCREILFKPVTLLCGHTFCCSCLNDKKVNACVVCGAVILQEKLHYYKTNITLSNVLHKWHAKELTSRAFCSFGALYIKEGKYVEAVEEFTKALACAPNSHTALVHRAEAYLLVGDSVNALKDSQRAVQLSKDWPKAHSVTADIFYNQHHYEEALFSYLMAYVLDSNKHSIKQRITSCVEKLVSGTKIRLNQEEREKLGLKRRKSQDSPIPVKHTFYRRSMEDFGMGEKFPRSLSYSCHNLSNSTEQPFSESDSMESEFSDPELNLDRILLARFCQSGSCVSSKSEFHHREVDPTLIDTSDFECSLCFRLLHNPVCTPCGHLFCQFCIERSLDHGTQCPLCKQSVEDSLAEQLVRLHPNCDYVTNSIIKLYLPTEHELREKQHKQEIEELSQNQPVFVCTIAYPSVPCPLHIFEPRYRLMLRRCLEFNKREFGMCMPGPSGTHCQTGTLLKVHNVTYFPDGRSVVECSGVRRFKTTNCRVKDGYNVAKLNYIVDRKPRDETATEDLSDKVYQFAQSWYTSLPDSVKETITRHFGCFPGKDEDMEGENGPNWHWWVLAVMPVEESIKTTVLGKNSFHDRLLILHRIFLCLQKRTNGSQRPQTSSDTR